MATNEPTMGCRELRTRVGELIAGTLRDPDRAAVEAHLARCEECAEVVAILRGERSAATPDTPPDLVDAVLARTTGSVCSGAEDRLAGHVDGTLPTADRDLVGGHLERCADCRRVAAAIERLGDDLLAMAVIEPDARFARDVLAATLPWSVRLARRFRETAAVWQRLALRPRFALEAGYVGAVLLVLVFGVPDLRAGSTAERALARLNPVALAEAPIDQTLDTADGIIADLKVRARRTTDRVLDNVRTRPGRPDGRSTPAWWNAWLERGATAYDNIHRGLTDAARSIAGTPSPDDPPEAAPTEE